MLTHLCWLLLFAMPVPQAPLPDNPPPSSTAIEKAAAAAADKGPRPHPVLIRQVDPEFTERARKKHVSGNVEVSLIVDTNGVPQTVTVVHGLGMGLDEKAVEAVRQYRFKPALAPDGTPLATRLNVDVNFQIF